MNPLDNPELEATDTPGYWRYKNGCPGGVNCRHAFRGVLGPCDGTVELTQSFFDSNRERGRFVSPYRTWRKARAAQQAVQAELLSSQNQSGNADEPQPA